LFFAERICTLRSALSHLHQTLGAVALYSVRPAFMKSTPGQVRLGLPPLEFKTESFEIESEQAINSDMRHIYVLQKFYNFSLLNVNT
jgi:hypothetical protein